MKAHASDECHLRKAEATLEMSTKETIVHHCSEWASQRDLKIVEASKHLFTALNASSTFHITQT